VFFVWNVINMRYRPMINVLTSKLSSLGLQAA